MKINRKSMKINENQWKIKRKLIENEWKSRKSYGNQYNFA